ncbi:MAG: hypothetical protein COB23_10210 [Methylophaga sp.]|nr:MAG: hypothetical protein COB23_10210 [Methylophaga sp.]
MTAGLLKNIALLSFFGLMASLIAWIIIAPHSDNYPISAMLLIALVPLLFPLRGILHGKPYTYAWTSFLMLFYFSHGVGEFYSADSFAIYPLLEIIFSVLCFSSAILYIKINAKMRAQSQNK